MSRELINNMLGFSEFDGVLTSMRGRPVFIAQHATATCCRGCIKKWHRIKKEMELSDQEIKFLVGLIMTWIEGQIFTKNYTEQHGTYT